MGQTITEKIFSDHVGHPVYAGEIIKSHIDMVIGNDITTPISIKAFEESGATKLANPDGFSIVMDHYIPAKDIASANQAKRKPGSQPAAGWVRSQSSRAPCRVRPLLSTPRRSHRASKELRLPGNRSLAMARESVTSLT